MRKYPSALDLALRSEKNSHTGHWFKMPHPIQFQAGWWLILLSFASGAIIGLGFHKEEFLGGYGSFRRRLLRLGHVACAALGLLNVAYGLSPIATGGSTLHALPGQLLLAGAFAMPTLCFLTAWKSGFRHLFFIPVSLLSGAVILVLYLLPS